MRGGHCRFFSGFVFFFYKLLCRTDRPALAPRKPAPLLAVFNIIAPVFAIVVLGYGAVRFKLYPQEGVKGLVAFVNNFATPCLLCEAMLTADFSRTFNLSIIGPFYIGAFILLLAGFLIARYGFQQRPGESVASGFSGTYTNTVLVGIPIALIAARHFMARRSAFA